MNLPLASATKTRAHPMLIIASASLVLVCLTGTAALMGWLPSSVGAGANAIGAVPDSPALSAVAPAPAPAAAPAPARQVAAAPAAYRPAHAAPVRKALAPVCQSCGVVESVREVAVRGDGSGLGAAGGAVVGGLLGNQVGGGHGKQAMTVVGAIGGALAGNQIEKRVRSARSYETTVRMDSGSYRTMTQASEPAWHDGDHVDIVDGVLRMKG
jgi:outer membrane lipoprotein SlyB